MLDFNGALSMELYKGIAADREREIEQRRRKKGRRLEQVERPRKAPHLEPVARPSIIAWLF